MIKYHLIVIGAGSGGLVSAVGAAGLGAKVALIEKNKMGGDCLNTGCVPSKAIIRTAKLLFDARTAARFGLPEWKPTIDLSKVMASVEKAKASLAHHDSVERMESLGITVYKGSFQFISPHEITDGSTTLSAKRFVIATGSRPFVPPIEGLQEGEYRTSDNIWELKQLPRRLVVLGGGPIGAELAQVFSRLGSKVTVVEMMEELLVKEDFEASKIIRKQFESEGITVLTGHKASAVVKGGEGRELLLEKEETVKHIPFDEILVAVGRAANVNELAPEKAGIKFSPKGVTVNAKLQTTAKHIYACGDVAGPYLFTHTADAQARLILRNALFPGKVKIDYRTVPWCTFTDPEVARVGLNEKEADEQKVSYDLFIYNFKDLDRAVCDREAEGFIKVLTKKGKDQILGITIVGSHAGDILHELALAMHQKIGLKKLANMIHIYPTLAEASKRLVDTYARTRLTSRLKKWMGRFLRWRFG